MWAAIRNVRSERAEPAIGFGGETPQRGTIDTEALAEIVGHDVERKEPGCVKTSVPREGTMGSICCSPMTGRAMCASSKTPSSVPSSWPRISRPSVRGTCPPEIRESQLQRKRSSPHASPIRTLAEVEKEHIVATLERLGGNRKETARALDIGENTLHRKLKSYGVGPRRGERRH